MWHLDVMIIWEAILIIIFCPVTVSSVGFRHSLQEQFLWDESGRAELGLVSKGCTKKKVIVCEKNLMFQDVTHKDIYTCYQKNKKDIYTCIWKKFARTIL